MFSCLIGIIRIFDIFFFSLNFVHWFIIICVCRFFFTLFFVKCMAITGCIFFYSSSFFWITLRRTTRSALGSFVFALKKEFSFILINSLWPKFKFKSQCQINILGCGYKGLVFCRNNGWIMRNMDKGLKVRHCTKMGADTSVENTPNTLESTCPICQLKPKSFGFQWKKASLGVRSPRF